MIIQFFRKRLFQSSFFLLIIFLLLTAKLYFDNLASYGCFDDCFNYGAGYFMLQGKKLYSEIFFNHNMLMAYISFVIQKISHPSNLYNFILAHRATYLLFAFIASILLAFRFRYVGIGFVIIYELSKFYIFGDRFLAEAFIIYPFVYLFLAAWESAKGIKISGFDVVLSGVLTWFVIFMREPYIPAALFLYVIILFGKTNFLHKMYSISIFLLLTLITLTAVSLHDYFFNIVTVNLATNISAETKNNGLLGIGAVKIFFYPLYILFFGKASVLRFILIGIDLLFISAIVLHIRLFKNLKLVIFILISLGLLNIRFVEPGSMYFASFHLIPWYGVFITATCMLIYELHQSKKYAKIIPFFFTGIILIICYELFSPSAFQYHQVDRYSQFNVSYGQYYTYGEVIKRLSQPDDTLFVDGFDELIYTQARLKSHYKYSWYTSYMPRFERYRKAREELFLNDPPDFYYGMCPHDKSNERLMPTFRIRDYEQVYFAGRLTCLFINKKKIPAISQEQWDSVKQFEFYLPKKIDTRYFQMD